MSKRWQDSVVQYHGGVNNDDRVEGLNRFQGRRPIIDPETHQRTGWESILEEEQARFSVGQQHSGGIGLTYTAASYAIYFSNDYSLEARKQSEDRIHRIGQKHKCTYIDLVAEDTLDEKVLAALKQKELLAHEIIDA